MEVVEDLLGGATVELAVRVAAPGRRRRQGQRGLPLLRRRGDAVLAHLRCSPLASGGGARAAAGDRWVVLCLWGWMGTTRQKGSNQSKANEAGRILDFGLTREEIPNRGLATLARINDPLARTDKYFLIFYGLFLSLYGFAGQLRAVEFLKLRAEHVQVGLGKQMAHLSVRLVWARRSVTPSVPHPLECRKRAALESEGKGNGMVQDQRIFYA